MQRARGGWQKLIAISFLEEWVIQRDRRVLFFGDVWVHWCSYHRVSPDFVVIHQPSLKRVTQFERKGHPDRRGEAIRRLTDWPHQPSKCERDVLDTLMRRRCYASPVPDPYCVLSLESDEADTAARASGPGAHSQVATDPAHRATPLPAGRLQRCRA